MKPAIKFEKPNKHIENTKKPELFLSKDVWYCVSEVERLIWDILDWSKKLKRKKLKPKKLQTKKLKLNKS